MSLIAQPAEEKKQETLQHLRFSQQQSWGLAIDFHQDEARHTVFMEKNEVLEAEITRLESKAFTKWLNQSEQLITELTQKNEELKQASERLKASSEKQENFIHVVGILNGIIRISTGL